MTALITNLVSKFRDSGIHFRTNEEPVSNREPNSRSQTFCMNDHKAPVNYHGSQYYGQYVTINQHNTPALTQVPSRPPKFPPIDAPPGSFKGRTEDLKKIHQIFENNRKKSNSNLLTLRSSTVVIHGLGGIGKSALASQYCLLHYSFHNGNVAWINSSSLESAKKDFLNLAHHLQIPDLPLETIEGEWDGVKLSGILFEQIYNFLDDHPEFCSSLFVFDGFEGNFEIHHILPPRKNYKRMPSILITSRYNKGWTASTRADQIFHLKELSEAESQDLLRELLGMDDQGLFRLKVEGVRDLAHALQGYPLAIVLAAASLDTASHWVITKFLSNLKKPGSDTMLAPDGNERIKMITTYEPVLSNVWNTSVSSIGSEQKGGQMALAYLNIMGYLPNHVITVRKVWEIFEGPPFEDLDPSTNQMQMALHVCDLLDKYSMIELKLYPQNEHDPGDTKIEIHCLVQKYARERLPFRPKILQNILKFQNYSALDDLDVHFDLLCLLFLVKKSVDQVECLPSLLYLLHFGHLWESHHGHDDGGPPLLDGIKGERLQEMLTALRNQMAADSLEGLKKTQIKLKLMALQSLSQFSEEPEAKKIQNVLGLCMKKYFPDRGDATHEYRRRDDAVSFLENNNNYIDHEFIIREIKPFSTCERVQLAGWEVLNRLLHCSSSLNNNVRHSIWQLAATTSFATRCTDEVVLGNPGIEHPIDPVINHFLTLRLTTIKCVIGAMKKNEKFFTMGERFQKELQNQYALNTNNVNEKSSSLWHQMLSYCTKLVVDRGVMTPEDGRINYSSNKCVKCG